MEPLCDWCGAAHSRDALCTSRPKWSRRGFLALFGAGMAGLAIPPGDVAGKTLTVPTMFLYGPPNDAAYYWYGGMIDSRFEPLDLTSFGDSYKVWSR